MATIDWNKDMISTTPEKKTFPERTKDPAYKRIVYIQNERGERIDDLINHMGTQFDWEYPRSKWYNKVNGPGFTQDEVDEINEYQARL